MAKPKPEEAQKPVTNQESPGAETGEKLGSSGPPSAVAKPLSPAEQLRAERAALEAELAEAEKGVLNAEQYRAEVTRALDDVVIQLQQSEGRHDNQLAIMAYIARSNEERAKRVARRNELLDLGADPSEVTVTPRSPLDQAIASKVRNKFPHRPQYVRPT